MRSLFVLFLLPATILVGCGPASPPKGTVTGKVTLNGEPLKEGKIHFSEPGKPPNVLQISGGSYSGQVVVGKKKVEIYAYKKVPAPPTATADVTETEENIIPAKYNANSKLEANVTKEGPNDFPFKLTSP